MRNLLIILIILTLVACTSVKVEIPVDDGVAKVSIRKFHPMGEELTFDGQVGGASLQVDKNTDSSTESIEALTDILTGLL